MCLLSIEVQLSLMHVQCSLVCMCRLSLASSFDQQASGATLDLDGDEESSQRKMNNIKRW